MLKFSCFVDKEGRRFWACQQPLKANHPQRVNHDAGYAASRRRSFNRSPFSLCFSFPFYFLLSTGYVRGLLQAARAAGKCGAGLRCEADIQLELSCGFSWGFSRGFSWALELPTYST